LIHVQETMSADRNLKLNLTKGKPIFKEMYAILGDYDLILTVDAPNVDAIVIISVDLHMMTGIHFSSFPALPVDYFDSLISKK